MVCGQQDNNVVFALVTAVVPLRGLGKNALKFQKYVILDAQRQQTIPRVKTWPLSRKLQAYAVTTHHELLLVRNFYVQTILGGYLLSLQASPGLVRFCMWTLFHLQVKIICFFHYMFTCVGDNVCACEWYIRCSAWPMRHMITWWSLFPPCPLQVLRLQKEERWSLPFTTPCPHATQELTVQTWRERARHPALCFMDISTKCQLQEQKSHLTCGW